MINAQSATYYVFKDGRKISIFNFFGFNSISMNFHYIYVPSEKLYEKEFPITITPVEDEKSHFS